MTETASLLILLLATLAAGVAVTAAVLTLRQVRLVSRRLHDMLQRLDRLPEPGRPVDIDALRVDVEWLVDTLTNELLEPRRHPAAAGEAAGDAAAALARDGD